MSDADRVYRRLVEHGSTTPLDWQPPVCDLGKPIMRLAARVEELRHRRGVAIVTTQRRPVARYELAQGLREDADGCFRLGDAA